MADAQARLLKIISDFSEGMTYPNQLCAPYPSAITLDTTVIDLGFDSLDVLELVCHIEDELNIELSDEVVDDLYQITRIGDLLNVPEIAQAVYG